MTTELATIQHTQPALFRSIDDYMSLASMLARSKFVPRDFQGNEGDVLAAILYGRSMNLDPMQALQCIAVINGKPNIYGDAALAVVLASGLVADVDETIEGEGDAMRAVCKITKANGKVVTTEFGVADARAAGLWGKLGPWSQYPRRMMQMRARSFGLRDAAPQALKGLITREEAQDYPQEPMKNVTPIREQLASPPQAKRFCFIGPHGELFETDLIVDAANYASRIRWDAGMDQSNRIVMEALLSAANEEAEKGGARRLSVQRQVQEAWDAMTAVMGIPDGDDDNMDGQIEQPELEAA